MAFVCLPLISVEKLSVNVKMMCTECWLTAQLKPVKKKVWLE